MQTESDFWQFAGYFFYACIAWAMATMCHCVNKGHHFSRAVAVNVHITWNGSQKKRLHAHTLISIEVISHKCTREAPSWSFLKGGMYGEVFRENKWPWEWNIISSKWIWCHYYTCNTWVYRHRASFLCSHAMTHHPFTVLKTDTFVI